MDHQRDRYRRHTEQQVGRLAEVRSARLPSAKPDGCGRHQRNADDRDQAADHHWRKEPQQPAEQRCNGNRQRTGGNDRAEHMRQAERLADHDHRRQSNERTALDQRQARAEAPQAEGLEQSGNAGGQQVGIDQRDHLGLAQAQGTAQNQRHRDGAGVHHQNMLQTEGEQLPRGQDLVHGMDLGLAHVVTLLKCGSFYC